MSESKIIFIVMIILFVVCVLLSLYILVWRKEIKKLISQTDMFIDKNDAIEYSLKDNQISHLQNNIADIETSIIRQKQNTDEQIKKNSQFIADISHQFKIPIAALKLYLELDKADLQGEHTDKELALVGKMENLISQVLTLEKINSNIYEMNFQQIRADEFIIPIASHFSSLHKEKNIVYNASGSFRCDKEWLSQGVSNIVKNACEHTDSNGEIEINIACDEASTTITVQDNGGGVEEDDLKNLFNRFYKAKNSKPDSAGIGLAISKLITQKHHGIITAENKNGGLCVAITIPNIKGYISI